MSKGMVLRHLGGEGQIEVMTRLQDFNIQGIEGPDGKTMPVPANTLVAFTATKWREIGEGSDEWEFVTTMPTAGGPVRAYMYLAGSDIFLIRALSRVQ
jgi:hypothetical protein